MKAFALLAALLAAAQAEEGGGRPIDLVRVHGNHSLPDEEVLRLAGVGEGDRLEPGDAAAIEERLRSSGEFESVDVRIRYRGLSTSSDVALVILVREETSVPDRIMAGPIVDLSDEYGLTFGGRVALVDVLVEGGRVAVPLSWGGLRQAGIESSFPLAPWGTLRADLSRRRQVNPHFDEPDDRLELGSGFTVERGWTRLDARGRWTDVDFQELEERFWTFGLRGALDTRRDPTIPGDAFYAGLDWRRLFFLETEAGVLRSDVSQLALDVRGYKRLVGQTLLAAQAYWAVASGPLPPYEQPFLGGGKTLRSHEPGALLGDNAALGTVELRMPLTSVTSFARAGVHLFYDTGAVYDDGQSLGLARFRHGVGAGAFFRVAVVGVRVDWGFDLEGGNRFHVASNFKF